MTSFIGHVCASAVSIARCSHFSALKQGIRIETLGGLRFICLGQLIKTPQSAKPAASSAIMMKLILGQCRNLVPHLLYLNRFVIKRSNHSLLPAASIHDDAVYPILQPNIILLRAIQGGNGTLQ